MFVLVALPALHIGTAAPVEQTTDEVLHKQLSRSWADLYYSSPASETLHRNSICAWDIKLDYEPRLRIPNDLYWADCKNSCTSCTLKFGDDYACQPVIRKIMVQRRKRIDTCSNNTVIYSAFTRDYEYLPVGCECAKLTTASTSQC